MLEETPTHPKAWGAHLNPTSDGAAAQEAITGLQADPMVAGPKGRSGWALARGLGQREAGLVLDRALAVHGPNLFACHGRCRQRPLAGHRRAAGPGPVRRPSGSASGLPMPGGGVPVTNGLVPAAWSASIWVREPASLVGLAPAGSLCRRNL